LWLVAADISILDIDMPGNDGFEVAREMRENNLPTEIIFLTMHKNEHSLNKALDLDVNGYLIKESAVKDLLTASKMFTKAEFLSARQFRAFFSNALNTPKKQKIRPLMKLRQ